jgi:LacI family transcriptional regulator
MIQDRLGHNPLAWNGDGVIATLRSDEASCECIRSLIRRGVPVVDLTASRPDISVPRVTSDHVEIGRLAAAHFNERNFKNVAWFSIGWGHVHKLRFEGLSEKTDAERWVLSEALPKRKQNDWEAFSDWISEKIASAPKPIAVLTYDESDATRLLYAAKRAGVSVPEELAILSIGNDLLICENQSVTLSSIDQDLERGGYEAAALLGRIMSGGRKPSRPILVPPGKIVLRQSTDAIAVSDPLVRQAIDYIKSNLPTRFGVAQIADALGTTPNILHKRFAGEIGRPVGSEIARQRLAATKLMLRNTEMTLAEIADATGYCTASHLSNTFRAATGTSPRAWRKKNPLDPKSPDAGH